MTTKPTSLRAYARRRRVSAEAVSKAVAAGRLRESVVIVGGQPKIADVELADREWTSSTRPRVEPAVPDVAAMVESALAVPDYHVSRALREAAAARREAAQADLAEIEVEEKRASLVSADVARADVVDMFTVVKTKILGVPTRVAQRLPHLAADVVPLLDELLREALEELAVEKPQEGNDASA